MAVVQRQERLRIPQRNDHKQSQSRQCAGGRQKTNPPRGSGRALLSRSGLLFLAFDLPPDFRPEELARLGQFDLQFVAAKQCPGRFQLLEQRPGFRVPRQTLGDGSRLARDQLTVQVSLQLQFGFVFNHLSSSRFKPAKSTAILRRA